MTLWLMHKDASIRQELTKVMPGAVWNTWQPKHGTMTRGVESAVATRIVDYLGALPAETIKVSTRVLKQAAGLVDVPKMTFTNALVTVQQMAPWSIEGRSLTRSFSPQI